MKKLSLKPRFKLKLNVEYSLKDKDGNTKQLFQLNKLGSFLKKKGFNFSNNFLFGSYSNSIKISNLITNTGAAAMASRINGDGAEALFNYIAIGTGVTAANVTDTALETEITTGGGARGVATVSRVTTDVTNDTAQFVLTYNFTSGFAVTESGVLNHVSAGVLLAHQVFSAITVVNGDSLQITWKIDVD